MSIIREKIQLRGIDISGLTITLGSQIGFLGYQEEIDNLTQVTSADLVNPVVDGETRRFKLGIPLTNFRFMFNGLPSFVGAGFTPTEISGHSQNMLNSFFILDYYNTYNVYNQTKIFTTYLTKIGTTPNYNVSAATGNQWYYWYVPISFIEIMTGTTTSGYVKLSFYNAKTGKVHIFYNNENAAMLTPQKMYFPAQLNANDMIWKMSSVIDARELTSSPLYNNRVNKTYDKYNAVKQVYPTGTTHYYKTNKYVIPDDSVIT